MRDSSIEGAPRRSGARPKWRAKIRVETVCRDRSRFDGWKVTVMYFFFVFDANISTVCENSVRLLSSLLHRSDLVSFFSRMAQPKAISTTRIRAASRRSSRSTRASNSAKPAVDPKVAAPKHAAKTRRATKSPAAATAKKARTSKTPAKSQERRVKKLTSKVAPKVKVNPVKAILSKLRRHVPPKQQNVKKTTKAVKERPKNQLKFIKRLNYTHVRKTLRNTKYSAMNKWYMHQRDKSTLTEPYGCIRTHKFYLLEIMMPLM